MSDETSNMEYAPTTVSSTVAKMYVIRIESITMKIDRLLVHITPINLKSFIVY